MTHRSPTRPPSAHSARARARARALSATLRVERSTQGSGSRREGWRPGWEGWRSVGRLRGVASAVLVVLLAGCSAVVPASSTPTSPEGELVAARRAAGIEDCPQPVAEPVEEGLPEMTLECLGGDVTVSLGALRGPMVINLWAQWCLPCRQEAPVLAAFDAARDDVSLLGINYDDPEPDWAIEFARLAGWTWPQLADPDQTVQAPLGIPGIPVSLLLDADGRIVARHHGAFDELDELTTWVDEGLA